MWWLPILRTYLADFKKRLIKNTCIFDGAVPIVIPVVRSVEVGSLGKLQELSSFGAAGWIDMFRALSPV